MSYGDCFTLCTCGLMGDLLTSSDHSEDCDIHVFVEHLDYMVELSEDKEDKNEHDQILFYWGNLFNN